MDTPADHCGLQVGDLVLALNGHSTTELTHSHAVLLLLEAARGGELSLRLRRPNYRIGETRTNIQGTARPPSPLSSASFDEKRSRFQRSASEESTKAVKADSNGRRDSSTVSPQSSASDVDKILHPKSLSSSAASNLNYRTPMSSVRSEEKTSREADIAQFRRDRPYEGDYRVVSLHEKPGPGKLSDFIPEVEREMARERREAMTHSSRNGGDDEPRLIRNYDLKTVKSDSSSTFKGDVEPDTTFEARIQHSTLPRNHSNHANVDADVQPEEDTPSPLDARDWRSLIEEQRQPSPGRPANRRLHDSGAIGNLPLIVKKRLPPVGLTETQRVWRDEEALYSSPSPRTQQRTPVYSDGRSSSSSRWSDERPSGQEVVAVSGRHRCSHCQKQLVACRCQIALL